MTQAHGAASSTNLFSSEVWRSTWRLGIAYWLFFLILSSVLWGMAGISPVVTFIPKLFLISFCVAVTLGMSVILYRSRKLSFVMRALLCLAMAVVATPIYCLIDHIIHSVAVYPQPVPVDPVYIGYCMIEGLALFFGWSCLSVSLLYRSEVQDRERLLAAAREEALEAQMRALRYQISPHFLFNTLNSIAGLIEEGSSARAGRMVLSLSTFLRTTLTLDPLRDVHLGNELALQEEYLQIERERFADRMHLSVEVEDDAETALVPSLILQPLIENAMKHGVGATTGKVLIFIRAYRQLDRLLLSVENDMPVDPAPRSAVGAGIGLSNVTERIRARFGDDGRVSFGLSRPGRYRALIDLPWVSA